MHLEQLEQVRGILSSFLNSADILRRAWPAGRVTCSARNFRHPRANSRGFLWRAGSNYRYVVVPKNEAPWCLPKRLSAGGFGTWDGSCISGGYIFPPEGKPEPPEGKPESCEKTLLLTTTTPAFPRGYYFGQFYIAPASTVLGQFMNRRLPLRWASLYSTGFHGAGPIYES
jgi:hypothetical protein